MYRAVDLSNLDHCRGDRPMQSVFIEFVKKNPSEILNLGEFEALRRWILSGPECLRIRVRPVDSHRAAREFYKALRKEQKGRPE